VTFAPATSLITVTSSRMRSVSLPLSSPMRNPSRPTSVRLAWPASTSHAPIVMTHPSVRSRPAIAGAP
jgi:hypothetical protein